MTKYNKELIEKLRNGEIALEYDSKSLEDLRAILKETFPNDTSVPSGGCDYYRATFSKTGWIGYDAEPIKSIPIKDFIQEEFVLPEKWCIKACDDKQLEIIYNHVDVNGNSPKSKKEVKNLFHYYHFPATNNYDFFAHRLPYHLNGYKEITFEQFQKYVLKQDNNMENKEIIGYLSKPEFRNAIQKIVPVLQSLGKAKIDFTLTSECFDIFKNLQVLDLWFTPVYKTKEQVFNMGSFEVVVKDGKAFHKSEDITNFVRELVGFYDISVKYFGAYSAFLQDVIFNQTGCENNQTKLSDWKKVYDALNQ